MYVALLHMGLSLGNSLNGMTSLIAELVKQASPLLSPARDLFQYARLETLLGTKECN